MRDEQPDLWRKRENADQGENNENVRVQSKWFYVHSSLNFFHNSLKELLMDVTDDMRETLQSYKCEQEKRKANNRYVIGIAEDLNVIESYHKQETFRLSTRLNIISDDFRREISHIEELEAILKTENAELRDVISDLRKEKKKIKEERSLGEESFLKELSYYRNSRIENSNLKPKQESQKTDEKVLRECYQTKLDCVKREVEALKESLFKLKLEYELRSGLLREQDFYPGQA
jgi:hypothetical protein